jgi:hypothetical protein
LFAGVVLLDLMLPLIFNPSSNDDANQGINNIKWNDPAFSIPTISLRFKTRRQQNIKYPEKKIVPLSVQYTAMVNSFNKRHSGNDILDHSARQFAVRMVYEFQQMILEMIITASQIGKFLYVNGKRLSLPLV